MKNRIICTITNNNFNLIFQFYLSEMLHFFNQIDLSLKIKIQRSVRYITYKAARTWYGNLIKPKPEDPPFKHVVQIGDPTLRQVAEKLSEDEIRTPEIQYLIKRLRHVFKKYNCVGLSAPQIGSSFPILIAEFNKYHLKQFSKKEIEIKEITIKPEKVIINPVLKIIDYNKVTFSESCESVRGFYADVPRYRKIELKGFDEEGKLISLEAQGWWARILQHEIDHLNGKLYTDIMDPTTLTCSCWNIVNERGGRVHIPLGHE